MRRARALSAALLALAASGCASLSGKECRTGDWTAIGRADGARGAPATELERHREACGAHGITPDAARYRAGHAQGLAEYCTPRGGYLAGRRGDGYGDACPTASAEPFLAAHRHGREVNNLLNEVRTLRRTIDELQAAAMAGDYGPEDRTQLRFRVDELNSRLRLREWELERLDRRYAQEHGAPELTWLELRN